MTSNEQSNRFGLSLPISARPSWGIPALAITMLAGTTQALAQNSGFGLLDAIEESSVEVDPESSQPREPVDFSDLEGSVAVNE